MIMKKRVSISMIGKEHRDIYAWDRLDGVQEPLQPERPERSRPSDHQRALRVALLGTYVETHEHRHTHRDVRRDAHKDAVQTQYRRLHSTIVSVKHNSRGIANESRDEEVTNCATNWCHCRINLSKSWTTIKGILYAQTSWQVDQSS